jgi:hypothetical protein
MRKNWWLIGVFFVLIGAITINLFLLIETTTIKRIRDDKLRAIIADRVKLCRDLKEDNRRISVILDEILNKVEKEPKLYQEIKKFRGLAQKAKEWLDENEKLINNILAQRENDNEKDANVVKNLSIIKENFEKTLLIHRLIINVLETILPEMKSPRQEISV